MKKSVFTALMFALPVIGILNVAGFTLPAIRTSNQNVTKAFQGSDLSSRIQAVEQRIATLRNTIASDPRFREHRGTLSTLENRKNNLKAELKTSPKNNAARPDLEKDVKSLEDKVAELEAKLK